MLFSYFFSISEIFADPYLLSCTFFFKEISILLRLKGWVYPQLQAWRRPPRIFVVIEFTDSVSSREFFRQRMESYVIPDKKKKPKTLVNQRVFGFARWHPLRESNPVEECYFSGDAGEF